MKIGSRAGLAVLLLGLAGCSESETHTPPMGLARGQLAPNIVGQDADGRPLKLSDFRGKVVVLDFWANW